MFTDSLDSPMSQAVRILRTTFGVLGLPTHRHVETMLWDPAQMRRIRCRERNRNKASGSSQESLVVYREGIL